MSISPDWSAVNRFWPVVGTYLTFWASPSTAAATARQISASRPVYWPCWSASENPARPVETPQVSVPAAFILSSVGPAAAPWLATRSAKTPAKIDKQRAFDDPITVSSLVLAFELLIWSVTGVSIPPSIQGHKARLSAGGRCDLVPRQRPGGTLDPRVRYPGVSGVDGIGMSPSESDIAAFERDGAICLRGVFERRWLELIAAGIEKEIATPGSGFVEQQDRGLPGRFMTDYCP